MIKTLVIMACLAVLSQPAFAAQSEWVKSEGGAMRLVITDDGNSPARGFLEIKLAEGWKTYWREPGDGGIPPSLTGDGMAVELQYPLPERISENGMTFSGYHGSVSLPFILPETLVPVDSLTAFIGVCSDICVPFQAEFPLLRDGADAGIVDQAFAQLPKPAGQSEGITGQHREGDTLTLTVSEPSGVLFLAPEKGAYLSVPQATDTGFTVKLLKEKIHGVKVHYTLKKPEGAVSGTFDLAK
jgi:DsbC/DsbD-like thiol-disulfide interchange protein